MDKAYISEKQCMLLILGFIVGTAIIFIPTNAIALAGRDAWLSPMVAAGPGVLLITVLLALNRLYPGRSIVQYSEEIFGWAGKFLGLVIIWFAFHLGSLVLRNIGDFVNMVLLFETPPPLVHAIVAIVCAFGLRLGIETLARCLSILVIFSIFFFGLIQIFTMFFADLTQLLPLLEKGFKPIFAASLQISAFPVGEIIIFSLLFFHVSISKKTGLYLSGGLLGGVIILSLAIERVLTVLGPEISSRSLLPVLITISAVPGGHILETIVAINWYAFTVTKFMICYYAFTLALSHWAKLPDYRPLLLPAGALLTTFSLFVYDNVVQEIEFATRIFTPYAIPIEYGIPLLLLVGALIKKGITKDERKKD